MVAGPVVEPGGDELAPRGPRAAARVSWSLLDQLLSNGTNVLATILAARALSQDGFGAYSATSVAFVIVLVGVRALVFEASLVRADRAGGRPFAVLAGGACAVALPAVVVLAVVAVAVGGVVGPGLAVFAACLPALAVQDAWRYRSFATRQPRSAVVADVGWLVGVALAFGALGVVDDRPEPWEAAAAWLVPGALVGLVLLVATRTWPSLRAGGAWTRQQSDLGVRYLVEQFSTLGLVQVALYVLAFVAGTAALGAARAGFAVFGPLQVLYVGVTVTLVPDGRRLAQRSTAQLRRILAGVSAGFLVSTLVVGAILWVLPDGLGRTLFGATWSSARHVIWPACAMTCAGSLLAGPGMGLRALERAADLLRARIAAAPVTLVLAGGGAAIGGAGGTLWGVTGGVTVAALLSWRSLLRALGEMDRRADGPPS